MPTINPWTYPTNPKFDRVAYLPGRQLHALEYQVEMIDSEGNLADEDPDARLISIDNHNIFKRSEENLYYELPISFSDAALGTSVEVPSIDGGKSKIRIPSGTQHGKQFRLKGKGMPFMRRGDFGDLYVQVKTCLLYTSPSPRDGLLSRMPSSA